MLTDLRKLRHVVGVADAASFTAASLSLGLTQSALTKSVAEVERLLDIRLFQRLARGVQLTEAGELFVTRARRILADTEDLMVGIDKLHDLREGRLRIGVGPAAISPLLEDALASFASIYPGIRLEIIDSDLQQVAQALNAGQLDLVVGEANYLARWIELEVDVVSKLHNCFIARPDHPLARDPALTVSKILAYPVVVPSDRLPTDDELASVYASIGVSPREPQYRCNSVNLVRKLIAKTDAIAPLLSFTAPSARVRTEYFVMEDIVPLREYVLGMAVVRQRQHLPAVNAFRDIFSGYRPSSRN